MSFLLLRCLTYLFGCLSTSHAFVVHQALRFAHLLGACGARQAPNSCGIPLVGGAEETDADSSEQEYVTFGCITRPQPS